MKILITGGAGFIGSHVSEKLLKEKYEVVVLDNFHTGMKENIPAGVETIEMDIRDQGLIDVFVSRKFDAVIHLAGQTMVNVSVDNPALDADINVMGTVNVLEACRKTGVKRIIFAATAAAYGAIKELPIVECAKTEPMSFYGLSKLTVERYLHLYHDLYGLDYVALRFANVYGERQGDGGEGGVISIFTKRIAAKLGITIHGDGMQTRDFIYAGDIAAAIEKALVTEQANDVYNVSTQTEVSLNEMVDILRLVSGQTIDPVFGTARQGDIYRSMLSNEKIVKAFGWKPEVSLKEGLAKTYQYFAKQNA